MYLELSSDQEFFKETTGRFLDDKASSVHLRSLRDSAAGFERPYWRQAAELGWTSLLVSEADGGGSISGQGLVDLTLVAYEFGRHAAPGPLLATNVVACALSRAGTDDQKKEVLAALLAGDAVASWCLLERPPHDQLGSVHLEAVPADGELVVDGTKTAVEAGNEAEHFLVTARTGDGLTQLLIPAATPGLSITPMDGVDLTRRFAEVSFSGVRVPPSSVVGALGQAADDVDRLLEIALVIQLAETVGAMDRAFEMTVEWAFNRYSFGRPLASYQELKHRFADMKSWLEASHAVADAAALAVHKRSPSVPRLVHAAKAYVGDRSTELIHDCVQIHGGIGVTFDHDLHLYLRRATQNRNLYGTPAEHRLRIADLLEADEAHA